MTSESKQAGSIDLPVALCLSGGGYRAMLFHAGSLLRMSETGWLEKLDLVSSVSGGSIIAGQLALQWERIQSSGCAPHAYRQLVLDPLLKLAERTIDKPAVGKGVFTRGGSASSIAAAYRQHLFGDKTLQDLPDHPRFVFNSTNMQSGALFRFSKPYARDYLLGGIPEPKFELATAVAASSAFPPFLSPLTLRVSPKAWRLPGEDAQMRKRPYTSRVVLGDGGIYDNLGLEPTKRSTTILASDGGAHIIMVPRPHRNWVGQLRRVLSIEDNQVRALRKRALMDRYDSGDLLGIYWSIRTDPTDVQLAETVPCPSQETGRLAAIQTRLAPPAGRDRLRLVNWGYALFDGVLRMRMAPDLPHPTGFPFPDAAL